MPPTDEIPLGETVRLYDALSGTEVEVEVLAVKPNRVKVDIKSTDTEFRTGSGVTYIEKDKFRERYERIT